jgi:hypothetical protein
LVEHATENRGVGSSTLPLAIHHEASNRAKDATCTVRIMIGVSREVSLAIPKAAVPTPRAGTIGRQQIATEQHRLPVDGRVVRDCEAVPSVTRAPTAWPRTPTRPQVRKTGLLTMTPSRLSSGALSRARVREACLLAPVRASRRVLERDSDLGARSRTIANEERTQVRSPIRGPGLRELDGWASAERLAGVGKLGHASEWMSHWLSVTEQPPAWE